MMVRLASTDAAPTEAEMRDYYDRHPGLYAQPQRTSLAHVFFSADRRGERAAADAARVLEQLSLDDVVVARVGGSSAGSGAARESGEARSAAHASLAGDEAAIRLGDAFLGGHVFAAQSRGALAKIFGDELADAAMTLPEGAWQGPVRSAYGFHLVRIRERSGSGRMPLASVRSQVLEGIEQERRDARLSAKLAELRAQYGVRIAGGDTTAADPAPAVGAQNATGQERRDA
jgi:hypothetical protein